MAKTPKTPAAESTTPTETAGCCGGNCQCAPCTCDCACDASCCGGSCSCKPATGSETCACCDCAR